MVQQKDSKKVGSKKKKPHHSNIDLCEFKENEKLLYKLTDGPSQHPTIKRDFLTDHNIIGWTYLYLEQFYFVIRKIILMAKTKA